MSRYQSQRKLSFKRPTCPSNFQQILAIVLRTPANNQLRVLRACHGIPHEREKQGLGRWHDTPLRKTGPPHLLFPTFFSSNCNTIPKNANTTNPTNQPTMQIPLIIEAFLTLNLSLLVGASSSVPPPTTIPIRLELQFDDRPSETGWHLWSESTSTTIAARNFDHYTTMTPHTHITEVLYLERGQKYHLVLLDAVGDGTRNGYVALFAEEAHRDTLLLARDGSSWNDHIMLSFEVPSVPSKSLLGKTVTNGAPSSSSSVASHSSHSWMTSAMWNVLEHIFRVDPYSVALYAGQEPPLSPQRER